MNFLFTKLVRFRGSKVGVAAVEFSLIAPTLLLLLFGCVTLFKIFDDSNRAENATFTVADVFSRQTSVSLSFFTNSYSMFLSMLPPSHGAVKFRVSSIKMLDSGFTVDWSYTIAPMPQLSTAGIPTGRLPLVSKGDSLIFVETEVAYEPITIFGSFAVGSYTNTAANRPRFTSAVVKGN